MENFRTSLQCKIIFFHFFRVNFSFFPIFSKINMYNDIEQISNYPYPVNGHPTEPKLRVYLLKIREGR